jgi:hypothetical protein
MGLKSFIEEQKRREVLKEEFISLVEELKRLEEKSKSKSQQRFMGMVHQCKKTGDCASKEVKDAADSMTDKEAKDFAKTKHKGLPEKVEEKRKKAKKKFRAGHEGEVRKDNAHMPPPTRDMEDSKKQKTRRRRKEGKNIKIDEDNPCWDGYEKVPGKKDYEDDSCRKVESEEELEEGGQCTGPTKKASSTSKGKKWMQCVKNPDGEGYKRVHWGQKGVRVTGDSGNTKRKKSFRARHDCKNAKKGTPKYQACKDW